MRLHLGCGNKFIPGFIHIDLGDFPHLDYKHSLDKLPMFADGSVDLIYVCHAFEYFDREEGENVLKEWHRILKPSGILRIAVPDFEAIVKVYLKYGLESRGILGPLYGKIDLAGHTYHKTVYDFNSLKKILKKTGFKNILRYDWRTTEHKNIDDFSRAYIPHMNKKGLLISLNMEAKK